MIIHNTFCTNRKIQKGAATLFSTMVLLLIMSIVLLYLNRGLIFEQKTSANQSRSTQALESAEAGMEWATGMLNTPYDIAADCTLLSTTNISFRRQYIQTKWNAPTLPSTDIVPATTTYPGCKLNGNLRNCSCPVVAGVSSTAALGTTTLPGFTVVFFATSDPEAVRVVVTGCTAQTQACSPLTKDNADATATISAVLKMRPLLRAAPASSLTCGGTCAIGQSFNIINRDPLTSGILVNSGGPVTQGNNPSYTSIPGQPVQNAVVSNDSSLTALATADPTCSNSTMFNAYFGSTIQQFAAAPQTKSIPNCNTNLCGNEVDKAYADGWRSFYFKDGFARQNSNGNLGTKNDPVTIVSNGEVNLAGNIDIYGMVFSNSAQLNATGLGTANVHGALVTCAGFNSNSDGTIEYDPDVLKAVQRSTSTIARIPGSWTDRCTASSSNPPVITCN